VGSHLSMTLNSLPYFSHFASVKVLNCRHPKSLIALASLRSLGARSLSWCAFPLLVSIPSLGARSLASYADAGSHRLRLSSSRGRTACDLPLSEELSNSSRSAKRRRGVAPLFNHSRNIQVF